MHAIFKQKKTLISESSARSDIWILAKKVSVSPARNLRYRRWRQTLQYYQAK